MLTDNTRKHLLGLKGYMTKSNTRLFATVYTVPDSWKCLRAPVKKKKKKKKKNE